jgi:hypothetical protein
MGGILSLDLPAFGVQGGALGFQVRKCLILTLALCLKTSRVLRAASMAVRPWFGH